MKNIGWFFLLIYFCTACNQNKENKVKISNDNLQGQWKWQRTHGGIGGRINKNATSTNASIIIHLEKDNKYSITENNQIVTQGKYRLGTQENNRLHTLDTIIFYNNNDKVQNIIIEGVIKRLNSKELSIYDGNPDGLTSYFVTESGDIR